MILTIWKEISGEYEKVVEFEPDSERKAKHAIHFNVENQAYDAIQITELDIKIGVSNGVQNPFIRIEDCYLKDLYFNDKKIFDNLNLNNTRMKFGLKRFYTGLNEIGFYDEFREIEKDVGKYDNHGMINKQGKESVEILTNTTKEKDKMKLKVFEAHILVNDDPRYIARSEFGEEFENQLKVYLDETIKVARRSDGYTTIKIEEVGTTLLVNANEKMLVIKKDDEQTASPNWKQATSKTIDKLLKDAFGGEYPQVTIEVDDEVDDEVDNETDDEVDNDETSSDFTIDDEDIETEEESSISTINVSSFNILEKYKEICPSVSSVIGDSICRFENRFDKYIKNVEIKSCYVKVETELTDGKIFRVYFHSVRKGSIKLRICQKNLPFLEDSEFISDQRISGTNVFYNVNSKDCDGWLELMAEHITADSEEQSMKTREKWEKEITEFRKQVNEKPISQLEMSNLKKINEETIWSYNRKYHVFGNEINLYAFINFNITGKLIYGTGFEMEERSILMVPMNMAEIDKEIGRDNFEDNISLYNALKDFFVNQLFNDENDFVMGPS